MMYRDNGPADRNRTCIPRLGGMCTIHCATASNRFKGRLLKTAQRPNCIR